MGEKVFAPWTDPNETPLIQFKNVTKRFGEFTAIDNQTFDIYEREFFALLGPSGCGKTTMMRMLAGFEAPSEGTILLGGQDIAPIPPNKRAVNMMFQSYALFPHLSIWENIAFGLKRDGLPKEQIAARVEEMLKLTRLEKAASMFRRATAAGGAGAEPCQGAEALAARRAARCARCQAAAGYAV